MNQECNKKITILKHFFFLAVLTSWSHLEWLDQDRSTV